MNSEGAAIGHSVVRHGALEKARGEAVYADDLRFPNMLYAAVLRSAYPHALIRRIDIAKAMNSPGVAAVLTHKDVPGRNSFGIAVKDQPVLAFEKVRYMGDAVALVAAETPALAKQAVDAIEVSYDELPGVFDIEDALRKDSPAVHEAGNLMLHRKARKGDVESAMAKADLVYRQVYRTQMVAHCPMELESGIAFSVPGGGVEVWCSTQSPQYVRSDIAACLGLRESEVRVRQMTTGGGFGSKLEVSVHCHLALLANKTKRPVKLTYALEDHFVASVKRHPIIIDMEMGVTKVGDIIAAKVIMYADTGAYASYGPAVVQRIVSHCTGAYSIPNVWADAYGLYTNNTPCGAMRGFGVPQTVFACESHIEAISRKLNINPIEIRLRNALEVGKTTTSGQVLQESVGLKKAIQTVASLAGLV